MAFGGDVIGVGALMRVDRANLERLADYLGVRVLPVADHLGLTLMVLGTMRRIQGEA